MCMARAESLWYCFNLSRGILLLLASRRRTAEKEKHFLPFNLPPSLLSISFLPSLNLSSFFLAFPLCFFSLPALFSTLLLLTPSLLFSPLLSFPLILPPPLLSSPLLSFPLLSFPLLSSLPSPLSSPLLS